MEYSKWKSKAVCIKCEHEMDECDKYYSDGVCPYCGLDDNSTICSTRNVIYRKRYIYIPFWWEFWISAKFIFEGKDEFSKQWILKNQHSL